MKKRIDELGRIVIPKEWRKEIGLENGKEAEVELQDNKIVITNPNKTDYKTRCEKAIEYIKENYLFDFKYDNEEIFEIVSDDKATKDLLEILEENKD